MYTKQPKKFLILNILDILRRYSDQDHRLSQKDIAERLEREYDMQADRKSIRRNLLDLMDSGYEIEYTEKLRRSRNPKTGEPETCTILSDFYLVRDFTDAELRLLIDSLLFSRHVPGVQSRQLMEKLQSLSSSYFQSRVRHIQTMPDPGPRNRQLFLNIETLDEAISRGCQVEFTYLEYGTDKQQHRRCRPDGTVRVYRINPYQMAARDGCYYLICNNDHYDTVSNYRIDRIADIRMLDTPVRPFETLEGAGRCGLDLAAYMTQHVFMYAGGSTAVSLRIARSVISDVIDLFGLEVTFSNEQADTVDVAIHRTNEDSVLQFVKRYAPEAILLDPPHLVDRVRADLSLTAARYEQAKHQGIG